MDATRTPKTPGDFRTSLRAFTDLLKKAIEVTSEETLDSENVSSLECLKSALAYLREGGMEDHLVVTGDLEAALNDFGFDNHLDRFAWPLGYTPERDGAWKAVRDAYNALDGAFSRVEATRAKQGLPKLWAREVTVLAARVGHATPGGPSGGRSASVAIIAPKKNPYCGYSYYLPTTNFGSPGEHTFKSDALASVISETFPYSARDRTHASLMDSLYLLRHLVANAQLEAPCPFRYQTCRCRN